MASRAFPNDVLKQAQDLSGAWTQISSTLAFGTLNVAALNADITTATSLQSQIANLENQLTDLRNKRDVVSTSMWDKIKRGRAGMKATYGDDSSQYEMVGGTRVSDRKTTRRKASAE